MGGRLPNCVPLHYCQLGRITNFCKQQPTLDAGGEVWYELESLVWSSNQIKLPMWKIRVNNLSQNHVVKSILQPAFYIHLVSTLHYSQEIKSTDCSASWQCWVFTFIGKPARLGIMYRTFRWFYVRPEVGTDTLSLHRIFIWSMDAFPLWMIESSYLTQSLL